MTPYGPVLIGVGGAAVLVAYLSERYHSRRFAEHVETLEALREQDRDDEIADEVRAFHDDRRVDLAIEAMFWGHVGGFTVLFVGLFVTLYNQ